MIDIKSFFPMIMALEKIGVSKERMRIMTPLAVIGQILGLISLALFALHYFRQCKVRIGKRTLSRLDPLNIALSDMAKISCDLQPVLVEVFMMGDGRIRQIKLCAQEDRQAKEKRRGDMMLTLLYNRGVTKEAVTPGGSQDRMLMDVRLSITLISMGFDWGTGGGLKNAQDSNLVNDQDLASIDTAFKAYVDGTGPRETLIKAIEDSDRYKEMLGDRRWYSPAMDFVKGSPSGLMAESSKAK